MQTWESIRAACESCTACPLCKTRKNIVFGRGNETASVMFIGEAPGESEDLTGLPFVGRAGKLLDVMLSYVDITPDDIYIANILKCRPPRNRDPLPEEEEACIGFLRMQTALLRPKIIVCLGRIAAKRIIGEDFKITRDRGKWYERNGVRVTAVYHPAALLRDPSKKGDTLIDLKAIADAAGIKPAD
ncbi:uracil-DNA glycosylase [Clostridia bacterium]|nr:uracil-DNA glycosylase [Clostridia bacterium]